MPNRRKVAKKIMTGSNFVVGRLMGGLGNQLFILFTTYSYAIDNNLTPYIKLSPNRRKYYFNTPLYEKLDHAKVNAELYTEPNHTYSEIPKKDKIELHGYFQSWKYFHKNYDKVMESLGINKLRQEIIQKYEKYKDFDICMHFRLGDYKNIQHAHIVCDIEYYKKALINFNEESKVLYFFEEEDRKKIIENISILEKEYPKMQFVAIDTSIVDYEQMFIMSMLKNFIIANSTFSWWGAYFSESQNKKVVYPEKWFGPALSNKNTKDMFLDDWIKV